MDARKQITIDHKEYPKRIRRYDDARLRFIIRDCREAMEAMPDNPKNGYYADEINYCAMELHKRAEIDKADAAAWRRAR